MASFFQANYERIKSLCTFANFLPHMGFYINHEVPILEGSPDNLAPLLTQYIMVTPMVVMFKTRVIECNFVIKY